MNKEEKWKYPLTNKQRQKVWQEVWRRMVEGVPPHEQPGFALTACAVVGVVCTLMGFGYGYLTACREIYREQAQRGAQVETIAPVFVQSYWSYDEVQKLWVRKTAGVTLDTENGN